MKSVLCGAVLSVFAGGAFGQTYNAAAEFSATANGGGVWSYGLQPGGAGTFSAFTQTQVLDNIDFWRRLLPFPGNYPAVGHNGTGTTQFWGPTSPIAAGELVMHPGAENAVLRFTPPQAGTYRLIMTARRTETLSVMTNGLLVRAGTVTVDSATMTGFGTQLMRELLIGREAGETIDVVVSDGGDGINSDSVAVSALLTRINCGPADIGSTGGFPQADGLLNNNDFIVYIDRFFASDARADIGTTGGTPGTDGIFDNNDFIVYIDQFFNGC